MRISFSPPDMTELEIEEAAEVIRKGWITTGPKTKEFERQIGEYCGMDYVVCMNSQTACAEMALRILGIGEGDEVIVPAYTYTASASPICHVGAKLVFVDVAKDSFEMDYDALEKAVTERTKAIIPVDVGGVLCDYSRIFDIVERKRGLFHPKNEIQEAIGRVAVVADSAHAFGAKRRVEGNWRKCGSIADFTSFSFHAVKNLTTAEGGALTWNPIKGIDDDWIYQQFMLYSLHGQSKDALAKSQLGAWEYDIVSPAYKCNMTDIMAAIGLGQLSRYSELLEIRKEIIDRYDSAFLSMGMQGLKHFGDDHVSSGHLYLLRMAGMTEKERNYFICRLAEEGVAANVHYKPLPMMTAYMELGFNIVDYPNAFRQYQNEITLPLHTCLSQEDVEYVVTKVRELLGRQGALKYAV